MNNSIQKAAHHQLGLINEKKGNIDAAINEYILSESFDDVFRLVKVTGDIRKYFPILIENIDLKLLYDFCKKQEYYHEGAICGFNIVLLDKLITGNINRELLDEYYGDNVYSEPVQYINTWTFIFLILSTDDKNKSIDFYKNLIEALLNFEKQYELSFENRFVMLLCLISTIIINGNLDNLILVANKAYDLIDNTNNDFRKYAIKILIVLSMFVDLDNEELNILSNDDPEIQEFSNKFYNVINNISIDNYYKLLVNYKETTDSNILLKANTRFSTIEDLLVLASKYSVFTPENLAVTILIYQLSLIIEGIKKLQNVIIILATNENDKEALSAYESLKKLTNANMTNYLSDEFQQFLLLLLCKVALQFEKWNDFENFSIALKSKYGINNVLENIIEF